jgi:PAS domain S-box-containing protein
MDDFVFVLDQENQFTSFYANQEMLFLSPDKFIGKKISEVMPAHINDSFEEVLSDIKEGKTMGFEYSLDLPDGEHWYSIKLSPMLENGNYIGLAAVAREITKSKHQLDDIKLSEYKFRSIFEGSTDGVALLDVSSNIIEVNKKACEILGYSKEELLKINAATLRFPDELLEEDPETNVQKLMNGESITINTRLRKKDGSYIISELNIRMMDDNRFLNIFRDITERKQADEILQKGKMELLEAQRIGRLGSWYLNLDTNEVVWSEELYKMYDYDPTAPPPPYTEHHKLFTDESWNRLNKAILKNSETGIPY